MTYKIGLGLLIEEEAGNSIRALQLDIVTATNDWSAFYQPPHVTVKRPIEVRDTAELSAVIASIREATRGIHSFQLTLRGHGNFNNTVLYANVDQHDTLSRIHTILLGALKKYSIYPDDFEADNIIFHCTLVQRQTNETLPKSEAIVANSSLQESLDCTIKTLGVFLGVDGTNQWIVLETIPLSAHD